MPIIYGFESESHYIGHFQLVNSIKGVHMDSLSKVSEFVRPNSNNNVAVNTHSQELHYGILTADDILIFDWPEPVWAVHGILPVGLTILAGAPKVGKSWLALQIAQAVASGGVVLGQQAQQGPVLYMALEDTPQRLKGRMEMQGWIKGLDVEFIPIGSYREIVGDLRNEGGKWLAERIKSCGYRLVVVDTFSRAFLGNQDDIVEMTAGLTPAQEMAHEYNCSIMIIDHHGKHRGDEPNAITDIIGSTAKGAMADTIWGLYRKSDKSSANMVITGRDVEETTLDLDMDQNKGIWQLKGEKMTAKQELLFKNVKTNGSASARQLADQEGRNSGTVQRSLESLKGKGKVRQREDSKWEAVDKM
jgi:RecA-family ATPase